MSHDVAEPRLPDIVLERYRLNELPLAEYNSLSDRLRRDEALRRRLESLDQSDREIRRDYQPELFIRRMQERLKAKPVRGVFPSWAIPAMLVAATLILVVVLPRIGPNDGDGDRIKGLLPGLEVYRKTDTGSETLADGAIAHNGDVIRLAYRSAGMPYGVILSIDGRGAVTLHLPANGDHAAALRNEPTVLLDQAYELDDAPRWERFFFVTGEMSFAVQPVMDAARRAASNRRPQSALELPRGLEQSVFLLQKEEPR
jgi:hypothetical protein